MDSYKRLIRSTGAAATAVLLGGMMAPQTLLATTTPLPGTISISGTVPNYFYDAEGGRPKFYTAAATTFADPANGLLFEYDVGAPCTLAALDVETLALKATDCAHPIQPAVAGGYTKSALVTVDSSDHLLFFANADATSIVLVSERTLTVVARWQPPSTLPAGIVQIAGLSWYDAEDELIVLTEGRSDYSGVSASALSIPAGLRTNATPSPLWQVDLSTQCAYTLTPIFASDYAYRSAHQLFIPCQLAGSAFLPSDQVGPQRNGVVSLTLGSACSGTTRECPDTSTIAVAVAPGQASDFLFDPVAERAFMPYQVNGVGVDALVYDGVQHEFLGRVAVGGPSEINGVGFGIDVRSGRLYAIGEAGLFAIDGRRTPLSPGQSYPQYTASVNYALITALPPAPRHPYTRVLVGEQVACGCSEGAYVPHFTVYADLLSVTHDPAPGTIDQNTYNGPIAPGSAVSTVYGGSARGFGVHTDFVGGASGVLGNLAQGRNPVNNPLPFEGTTDLVAGTVWSLRLRNGIPGGDAAALLDGNSDTSTSFQSTTKQPWPYPDAACPGTSGEQSASSNGVYDSQGQTPGPDARQAYIAHAAVNCADSQPSPQSATGDAEYQGMHLTGPSLAAGLPSLDVGASTSTASVQPPVSGGRGVTGRVTSIAHGVHVDLGTQGQLWFGEVTQKAAATAGGRTGKASTTDVVILRDVDLQVGSTTEQLCHGICTGDPEQIIQKINAAFPTLLRVSLPAADAPYGWNETASGGRAPKGSPGGYAAAVQANLVEQHGDAQFNAMSKNEYTFLPALRIVLYGPNDGVPNVSREVVDLAGVDVDAEQGIDVFPVLHTAAISPAAAAAAAGVPPTTAFLPGTPGTPPVPAADVTVPDNGPLGLLERVFGGLSWLVRSPRGALQMMGFLFVLGLPLWLMDRRRLWIRDIFGEHR